MPSPLTFTELQTVKISANGCRIHGFIYASAKNKLYATTVGWYGTGADSPISVAGYVLKIDPDDLTVRTQVWIGSSLDIIYDDATDRLYAPIEVVTDGPDDYYGYPGWYIWRIHPDTLAVEHWVSIASGSVPGNNQSIASDGTYIYVANSLIGRPTKIAKFNISTGAMVGTPLSMTDEAAHAIRYDAATGKLFVTSNSSPAWIARIDPATMTVEAVLTLTGFNAATDDFTFVGDDVYVGFEMMTAPNLARVPKNFTGATVPTGIDSGVAGVCYGMCYSDGFYSFPCFATSPGSIAVVNPIGPVVEQIYHPTQGVSPNEIVQGAAGVYYVCFWNMIGVSAYDTDSQIMRMRVEYAAAEEQPNVFITT